MLFSVQLIPVIDIKDGIAVHAKLGLREQYQPILTPLCSSCKLTKVVDAFLTLYPFKIIYLADLNAITKKGDNFLIIEKLLQDYPQIIFWIDSGYQTKPSMLIRFDNYYSVLGSECYLEENLKNLKCFEKNFILSLDFSAQNQPLGAASLFHNQELWPAQIILMTLARVGSYSGVDFEILDDYRKLNSQVEFIASGGIRNIEDALILQRKGINKALCASALHSGLISRADIQKLQAKKYPE